MLGSFDSFRRSVLGCSSVGWLVVSFLALGCSADGPGGGGDGTSGDGTGGDSSTIGGGSLGDPNVKPPATIEETLPDGFTAAQGRADGSDSESLRGGWQLVGPLADIGEPSKNSCANVLRVLIRDFEHTHVDFGAPKEPQNALGMVASMLGDDRKPVPTGAVPSSAQSLGDWYVNIDGVNVAYVLDIWMEPEDDGSFVFDSSRFFPLDSVGTPSGSDDDGVQRNFGFTTELHTAFAYQGGETFTFRGDDDVFVFINGQLVVDLGGVHGPVEGSVALDTLGLTPGQVYTLDLFQAERNPTGSNFRIETTLDFTDCGSILDVDVK